jgi:uncharacterized protein (DUF736 family)
MALKRVGALWNKTDKKKKDYMSGTMDLGALGAINVMIFQNEKAEENHPDWTIHLVTPDESSPK